MKVMVHLAFCIVLGWGAVNFPSSGFGKLALKVYHNMMLIQGKYITKTCVMCYKYFVFISTAKKNIKQVQSTVDAI
jgi:hypothetical protein